MLLPALTATATVHGTYCGRARYHGGYSAVLYTAVQCTERIGARAASLGEWPSQARGQSLWLPQLTVHPREKAP